MAWCSHVAVALVLAAWATQPYPSTASALSGQVQLAQYAPPENCREFSVQVIIGGQPQQLVGQACQRPDGSWQMTQTFGVAPRVYPPPIYAYPYPGDWPAPWIFGPPFVGSSFVFIDRFHRFHHDGFRHDGFHHAFRHDGFRHDGFHTFRQDGFMGGFHGRGHR